MALGKVIKNKSGHDVKYWVAMPHFEVVTGDVTVMLYGFKDKQSRDGGAMYADMRKFPPSSIDKERFFSVAALSEQGMNHKQASYLAVKEFLRLNPGHEFDGAVDE